MISHIGIKDFAIIKDLSLDLYPGLNVITGETGAGKSIIIEAVSMALGSRADSDYIRNGAEKAVISLVADSDDEKLTSVLEEAGVPADMPMVIHREIGLQRSLCRINGTIVPLSLLSKVCRSVADIHGQYDHQSLLDPENHLGVLDLFGGEETAKVKEETAEYYQKLSTASTELEKLKKKLAESKRQRDLLEYELSEIDGASVKPGEDEQLDREISVMSHSEQIFDALSGSWEMLFGGDTNASQYLGNAMESLDAISVYSDEIKEIAETVSTACYSIEDLSRKLRSLRDGISFSREELNEKISRRETIENIKRKYGGSLEKLFEYRDKAAETLNTIENADSEISRLQKEIRVAGELYDASAGKLSALREKTAEILGKKITAELSELAFSDSSFYVDICKGEASSQGSDKAEFLIVTNKGSLPRPLAKVASGGELSRIMLAMKRITGDMDSIPTMVFDEIDTGISGATAGVVGEKLMQISSGHQIICITHLPQIACRGRHHFRIEKSSDGTAVSTNVIPLDTAQRTEEIARLISGTEITEAARIQARQLLKDI